MGTPNHNDDWTDLKTKGDKGQVLKVASRITAATTENFISALSRKHSLYLL